MVITIKDIAKRANVSITTVSRVINNKHDGISKQTVERILGIVEELNYQPNALARGLITKRTLTIGLILPSISNPFFPNLVRGVEDVVNQANYSLFLCNTDDQPEKEKKYIQLMREKNVDGVIFSSSYTTSREHYEELMKANIPIVLIDRGEEGGPYSGVFIHNEEAGFMATQHLIQLHHKRIGCITGPRHIHNAKARLEGYLKALSVTGIPIEEKLITSGNFEMKAGYRAARQMLTDCDW